MPKIIQSKIIHEFTISEITVMLSRELKVSPADVEVEFVKRDVSSPDERYPRHEISGVRVSVDMTKQVAPSTPRTYSSLGQQMDNCPPQNDH